MRRIILLCLVTALGLVARAATSPIILEGNYPNHLQDVWVEGDTIWWVHTDWLVKTDLSGRILTSASVGGHHAGLEIRNGRLYTAVCAWNGEPRSQTDATCHVWIGEYDAATLARIGMHCLDINDRAGSLCILDDGSFLVGCLRHPSLAPTEVKFHHIDASYRLIRTHVVDTSRTVTLGIETIHRDGEAIHLFMGGPTVRLDARTLEVLGKFSSQGGDRGFSRDGDSAWFGQSKTNANGRWESKLVRKKLEWTYIAPPGAEVPRAFVRNLGNSTVSVGDGTNRNLSAAVALDVWLGGVAPSVADQSAALTVWGDYGSWRTELVAMFDRAVAADSLAFCVHSPIATNWSVVPLVSDVAAGDELVLPLAPGVVSYRNFVTNGISGFGCGVQNLSRANIGAASMLCLRLREPYSGETKTLARTDLRLHGGRNVPWFDSSIPQYVNWPDDAALAVGGMWNVGAPASLDAVAAVTNAGELAISTGEMLDFDADDTRTLGANVSAAVVDLKLELSPRDTNDLPSVDSGWKGGVLSALAGSELAYYGLAKVGDANAWVRLEGPSPSFNGGTVLVKMTLRAAENGRSTITYQIDGETCTYGGNAEIDLVVASPLSGVAFGGCGRVLSLDGTCKKPKPGLTLVVR